MKKNDKNLSVINTRNWSFVSSLFDLFLKYNSKETPTAAINIASKIIGQYVVPKDIKLSKF